MLVMMVVMLGIVLLRPGHMGMMGYGGGYAEKPAEAAQQTQSASSDRGSRDKTPLEILQERYARGEIDKEEYEQKKRDLKQ